MWIKRRWKQLQRKREYEELLFIHFLLWITIPVIIMGCVSYSVYMRGESKRNKLMLDSYSKQVMESYDSTFTAIREYYLETTHSDDFKWLVQQNDLPYHNIRNLNKVKDMLRGNYYIYRYVKSYNFINLKKNWVMNNYGTLWYDDLKNFGQVNEFLQEQNENNNYLYWLNRSGVSSPYDELIGSCYLDVSGNILVVKNCDYAGNIEYLLVIQMDFSELEALSKSYQSLGYDVTVRNREETLMQTNPAMTEAVLNTNTNKNNFYDAEDGTEYQVSMSDVTTNGLQYIVGYDRNQNRQYAATFFMIALIVIPVYGASLYLLKYLSKVISIPFKTLQNYNANQYMQIKELLMSNLLKGEWNETRINSYIQTYNLTPFNHYRLIVIRRNWEQTEGGNEQSSFELQLLQALPEDILMSFFIVPVIYEQMIVAMIGGGEEMELDWKVACIYKQIKDYSKEQFDIPITAGISKRFEKLTYTNKAYGECLEVLNHRCHDDTESMLALYDDYSFMNVKDNAYEGSIEKELCAAISHSNEEESRRLLSLILQRMEPLGLWGIERNFYLNRLLMDILSIPIKESLLLSEIFYDDQYNVMNLAGRIYEVRKLEAYIMTQIITPIISALKIHKQSHETEIVKKVILLIRESKGNITLSECAETLNYHPSYLSRVVKVENGLNFSDMVNSEKMKLAKYMLLTSELSISEISGKLNYNNVQNFIRFFKNQVGITPARFRKNSMNIQSGS